MAHYGVDGGDLLNIKQSLTGNQRAGNSIVEIEPLFQLWQSD
jgi:hypothetical protein